MITGPRRGLLKLGQARGFASGFGLRYDKKQDFYEALGVPPRSKDTDIKKAYYKLAQKYHPDKAPGDKAAEEKFKTISAAYEVLKDESQRKLYDQMREAAHNPNSSDPFPGATGGSTGPRYEYETYKEA